MNIRDDANWTAEHEARLQTLLELESFLVELRGTEPNQEESGDITDTLTRKRSAQDILESLMMRITPSQHATEVALSMFEQH